MTLQETIKLILQQANIESISTKDMVKELTNLYSGAEKIEKLLQETERQLNETSSDNERLRKKIDEIEKTHLVPVEQMRKEREKLEKDKFEFFTEKKYIVRENQIYRETLAALTASKTFSESYGGGSNGAYWNKSDSLQKPMFPTEPMK